MGKLIAMVKPPYGRNVMFAHHREQHMAQNGFWRQMQVRDTVARMGAIVHGETR